MRIVRPLLSRYFTTPMSSTYKPPLKHDLAMFTDSPLKRPGFGIPLGYEADYLDNYRYAHGVNDFHADRLTVREIAMLQVMDALTDKPSWDQKVLDDSIVDKWRIEALHHRLMSERAWDWCLRELRDKADFYAKHGYVTTLHQQAPCVKSDTLITSEVRDALLKGVEPLLSVDAAEKDWHPNSNDQVLNLVHPSMHCLVYGRTRVLENDKVGLSNFLDYCGQGIVAAADQTVDQTRKEHCERRGYYGWRHNTEDDLAFSTRFAWLPSEVQFKGTSGTDVEFTSYINNLHPIDHRDLYKTIEKILSTAIPMWNECLVKGYHTNATPRIKVESAEATPAEMPDWVEDTYDHPPGEEDSKYDEFLPKVREYLSQPDDPDGDFTEDDRMNPEFLDGSWEGQNELSDAVEWKFERIQRITHPEPGEGHSFELWKKYQGPKESDRLGPRYEDLPVRLERDFRERGLQVFTKLASIELTPDKPDYAGGSWHLEGLLNEHIVGTAIYYYSTTNTTPSHLSFRVEAQLDNTSLHYKQNHHRPLATIFGTSSLHEEPAIQPLGSLSTPENRLLVFPNSLQHRLEPFSLADASQPGHRRFLVLWLVDPHYRVLSTANVPPQQHDWWAREALEPLLRAKGMPPEMDDLVREAAGGSQMSRVEAREYRSLLMTERTRHMPTVKKGFDSYNFCEH